MMGKDFKGSGQTYEIEAIVAKDTRMGSAKIDIVIEAINVPILELR